MLQINWSAKEVHVCSKAFFCEGAPKHGTSMMHCALVNIPHTAEICYLDHNSLVSNKTLKEINFFR